jgi:hypothetical protein
MAIEARLRRLEQKLNPKAGLITLVINFHPDAVEQEKIRIQALSDAGVASCKDVIFVIHYGSGPARNWQEECLL